MTESLDTRLLVGAEGFKAQQAGREPALHDKFVAWNVRFSMP
jgi:hypothetical protein